MSEDPPPHTIISRCSAGPRLISDRVRSFPRREPKPARERLGPLKRRAKHLEADQRR